MSEDVMTIKNLKYKRGMISITEYNDSPTKSVTLTPYQMRKLVGMMLWDAEEMEKENEELPEPKM